jgi:hypothetical protein
MKIPLYWIEKFKLESLDVEMIKEIQKDAYNSALKDVQGVLPGNPCPNRREDIANAISGLRK